MGNASNAMGNGSHSMENAPNSMGNGPKAGFARNCQFAIFNDFTRLVRSLLIGMHCKLKIVK